MQLATLDAPRPASGTGTETTLDDRTNILNSFIIANSLTLTEEAHDAGKHRLFFTAPEVIIAKLAGSLHRYGGPTEEQSFLQWATRFVRKGAEQWEITTRILEEYSDLIHKAIHECLWTSAQDCSVSHEDVFADIVLLIFKKAHQLDRKGKAKLSTRIYALAERHIFLYCNKRNASRRQLVQRHKYELRVEHFSDEELAAMRAAEKEDGVYDPGYAEAGLSLV